MPHFHALLERVNHIHSCYDQRVIDSRTARCEPVSNDSKARIRRLRDRGDILGA